MNFITEVDEYSQLQIITMTKSSTFGNNKETASAYCLLSFYSSLLFLGSFKQNYDE